MSKKISIFGKNSIMAPTDKIGKPNIVTHIIVWAMIFLFPIIISGIIFGQHVNGIAYKTYVLMGVCVLVLFYLNYSYLINKLLFNHKSWKFFFINFVAVNLIQGIEHIITLFIQNPEIERIDDVVNAPFRIVVAISGILIKVIIVLIAVSMRATNRVYIQTREKDILEKEKTEAELKNLKNKLNPHFLFNALNNIYALTAFDSEKAQAAIDSLSKLLRYVLYENDSDLVPLEGELEFTTCYIDLMSLRLDPSRSTLSLDIDQAPTGNYHIATLMFMTLIENAFKHGVSSREHSYINISIKNEDRDGQKWIICCISNSLFPKSNNDKSGSGIGLDNLKQRLELIYKDEHKYEVTTTESDYTARIEIPLKQLTQ